MKITYTSERLEAAKALNEEIANYRREIEKLRANGVFEEYAELCKRLGVPGFTA